MSAALDIAFEMRDPAWRAALADAEALCRRAALAAAATAERSCPRAELGIVLADDAAVRALNRDWRGVDAPTNVLAFPCDGAEADGPGPVLLGDVVIARETAAAEARGAGRALADHLSHLVVHGTLHLFGYDHAGREEAERMEALETRVLADLGIADPYRDAPALDAGEAG